MNQFYVVWEGMSNFGHKTQGSFFGEAFGISEKQIREWTEYVKAELNLKLAVITFIQKLEA